jgi:hypothetical protein
MKGTAMESPRYLIGQMAAERGVSECGAKRALYLQGLAGQARSVSYAAEALGVTKETIKTICRRYMIDMADYRPYERLERKGQPRPGPKVRDIHKPASALPIFGGA